MKEILNMLKKIQSMSEIGQHFSHNEFDLSRYKEIEALSLELIQTIFETKSNDLAGKLHEGDGYKTPKVDVRAVVFNNRQQILLVKEKIDGKWSLPGGWADIGYSPSEIAIKEAREEAGAVVKPSRLLGIVDKRLHQHPSDIYYIYKIFIECTFIEQQSSDNLETSEYGFFALDDIPPLSLPRNTKKQIKTLFDYHSGSRVLPFFD